MNIQIPNYKADWHLVATKSNERLWKNDWLRHAWMHSTSSLPAFPPLLPAASLQQTRLSAFQHFLSVTHLSVPHESSWSLTSRTNQAETLIRAKLLITANHEDIINHTYNVCCFPGFLPSLLGKLAHLMNNFIPEIVNSRPYKPIQYSSQVSRSDNWHT